MSSIEKRVEALEQEVSRLKALMMDEKARRPWWNEIAGTFKDDPVYKEAMELGRKYRESTRPKAKRRKSNDASS